MNSRSPKIGTGSNPYFLVIYMDSLNSLELEKTEEGLTPAARSRALLQHAAGTLGGILQKQNSTAALGDARGRSQDHQGLGPPWGRPCPWTRICPWCSPRAKYALGEHGIVLLPPSKTGCVRFKMRNELVLTCLPAASPLLQS